MLLLHRKEEIGGCRELHLHLPLHPTYSAPLKEPLNASTLCRWGLKAQAGEYFGFRSLCSCSPCLFISYSISTLWAGSAQMAVKVPSTSFWEQTHGHWQGTHAGCPQGPLCDSLASQKLISRLFIGDATAYFPSVLTGNQRLQSWKMRRNLITYLHF